MTDKAAFLRQVQASLSDGGKKLEPEVCQAFFGLSMEDQVAFAGALAFVGCSGGGMPTSAKHLTIPLADRVAAAKILLLRLSLGTGEPKWSSWLLEQLWRAVLGVPGGQVSDLYRALFELLAEFHYELTPSMATFIQALTYNGRLPFITPFQAVYLADPFDWLPMLTQNGLLPLQAYLLTYSAHFEKLSAQVAVDIMRQLVGTPYWHDCRGWLLDMLISPEGKMLLEAWLAEGVSAPYQEEIEGLLAKTSEELL